MTAASYHPALWAALALGAPAGGPDVAEPQRVLLQVELPADLADAAVTAEIGRLGETVSVALADDGRRAWDFPGDGVHTAAYEGPYARYTDVRLTLDLGDGPVELYSGRERTDALGSQHFGWVVQRLPAGWRALRSPAVRPGAAPLTDRGLSLVAAFGWGAVCLVYVGWLAWLRVARP